MKPEDLFQYVNTVYKTQHEGAKNRFLCQICNKPFQRMAHARDHVENVHYPEMFVYTCTVCSLQVKSRVALRNHMSNLHPQRRFVN